MTKGLPGQRGFTLVELLVVVAIIALLAGVAAPKIHATTVSSREAKVAAELQVIHVALEQHYLEHSFYPIKLNDLVTRGYLKPTSFRSPASGHWYFYIVDDNRDEGLAMAYALGAPPKNAHREEYRTLYRDKREIPEGRNPKDKARAWLRWEVKLVKKPNSDDYEPQDWLRIFVKYAHNDSTTIQDPNDLPTSLSDYRTKCRSSHPGPCDLITN